jgi:nucleoside-diphosphate-sugar epimerase
MKVLIVGGTGLTGAHAALYLAQHGHDVTLMSRSRPSQDCLQKFPHISHNYIEEDIDVDTLRVFDSLVFAAGADLRLMPAGESDESFFTRANTKAIPRFFEKARQAGIQRAVYIGTYYPQVAPDKIETSAYVRSRHLADTALRELGNESFCVCSLNAPFIIGYVPGLEIPHLRALVQYAAGQFDGMPMVAPAGGVNHISSQSMSEAILSALLNGQCGKAYLVGDENLSWKSYLEMFCEAVGNPQELAVTTDEHPMFPDIMMYAGRNAVVSYEPEMDQITYSRGLVREAVEAVVGSYGRD